MGKRMYNYFTKSSGVTFIFINDSISECKFKTTLNSPMDLISLTGWINDELSSIFSLTFNNHLRQILCFGCVLTILFCIKVSLVQDTGWKAHQFFWSWRSCTQQRGCTGGHTRNTWIMERLIIWKSKSW